MAMRDPDDLSPGGFAVDATARRLNAAGNEVRARHELDLTGRARAVIDQNLLPKPQIDDLGFAADEIGARGGGKKSEDASGRGGARQTHLFCTFSPPGPTLICRPFGS